MSLFKKSQRIFSGLNLIGNFVEKKITIGDIIFHDDGEDRPWLNIKDIAPDFSLEENTIISSESDFEYTTKDKIGIAIGDTTTTLIANGEIHFTFNAKNSAFISLKNIKRTSIKLGKVETILKEHWKKNEWDTALNRRKYHFVSEIIEAESGVMLFSEDKATTIVMKGKNNIPLTAIGDISTGNIEFGNSSKSVLKIICNTTTIPLYTAVRYKSNGNFEIVG